MSTNGHATIAECLQKGTNYLKSCSVPESRISAEELLSHVLKRTRTSLYVDAEATVDSHSTQTFEILLKKRASRYPLQYLLRSVPFRSIELEVGEGCLIPRPETELLIDVILQSFEDKSSIDVLDVGTGSGNIAISLASERPKWKMVGTDISEKALNFAKMNAVINEVADRIRFVQTDLWKGLEPHSFDAIVSNPPYLTSHELSKLQPELCFEPREALDGKEKGLFFYERMILSAARILKRNGKIFFEIGLDQAKEVSHIFKKYNFSEIQTTSDYAGIERIISACIHKEN